MLAQFTTTSFDDSMALLKANVIQIIEPGTTVYEIKTKDKFIITAYDKKNKSGGMYTVSIDNDTTPNFIYRLFNLDEVVVSYSTSDLALLIPNDYLLPTLTVKGWAFTGNDGSVFYAEDNTFFKTEVEARAKFLLFFLKIGVVELPEIEKSFLQGKKVLA